MEDNRVTFRWRDSADDNKIKLLTIEALEFIRRFLLHVLPNQFVKIRYYGILSHRSRKGKLLRCRRLLGVVKREEPEKAPKGTWQDLLTRITGIDPRICPHCGKGKMIRKEILPPCSLSVRAWGEILGATPLHATQSFPSHEGRGKSMGG